MAFPKSYLNPMFTTLRAAFVYQASSEPDGKLNRLRINGFVKQLMVETAAASAVNAAVPKFRVNKAERAQKWHLEQFHTPGLDN